MTDLKLNKKLWRQDKPNDDQDQNETRTGKALKFLQQKIFKLPLQQQGQVGSNSGNPTTAWTFHKSLMIGFVLTFL